MTTFRKIMKPRVRDRIMAVYLFLSRCAIKFFFTKILVLEYSSKRKMEATSVFTCYIKFIARVAIAPIIPNKIRRNSDIASEKLNDNKLYGSK